VSVAGLRTFLLQPLEDYLAALETTLRRPLLLVVVILAFIASWLIYVPLHELAHAFGCVAAGGNVSRLEIGPWYGGIWLQQLFPFVVPESAYAGRLSGFDTHGSDLTYLATDAAPFLLTVVLGVPLLRSVRQRSGRAGISESIKFGAALPFAFAPFISLTGDYYEMGSILISRLAVRLLPGLSLERWRSDDIFRLAAELSRGPEGLRMADVAGLAGGFLVGCSLAWATYGLGALCSRVLRRGH